MLNIISEISEIKRKMKDLSDEETVKNVEKMKEEFLPAHRFRCRVHSPPEL